MIMRHFLNIMVETQVVEAAGGGSRAPFPAGASL
jgi:hypothetical protein